MWDLRKTTTHRLGPCLAENLYPLVPLKTRLPPPLFLSYWKLVVNEDVYMMDQMMNQMIYILMMR